MNDRKAQIQIEGRALELLNSLKEASGRKTVVDVIKDAFAFYDWARRRDLESRGARCVCGMRITEEPPDQSTSRSHRIWTYSLCNPSRGGRPSR